ncbi:MAG: rhomboid family intramembrane serine protease [Planctomycetota bacterium]
MKGTWEDPPESSGVAFATPSVTPVVKLILSANIAIFLLQWIVLEGFFPRAFEFSSDAFALNPRQWVEHFPLVPVWQLLSYGFLHGGPEHLLSNMLFLFFLGTMLEGELGPRRFLVFYLAAVAFAGFCQLGLGLGLGQQAPIVGASGGLLAVVCAMATMRPMTRLIFVIVPVTLRTVAILYVALDLFFLTMELKGSADSGVARFAHLSGALFGYVAVKRGWVWRDPVQAVDAWRERKAEEQEATDEQRLDELLVKIKREGIHALSPRERDFLKRVSGRH